MGSFGQIIDKLRALFRAAPAVPPSLVMPPTNRAEISADDAPLINDMVDYSQPMMLPGWVRREWAQRGTLQENVSSMAQTYASQFGNPYRTAMDGPMMPTTEDPLCEWDWMTRERVLTNTHAAYQRNPLANSIVQFTRDFVIGDGFNLTCKNQAIHDALQAFIDDPDNAIREYEKQAIVDLQVDGEIILRIFDEAGRIVAVPQRPWELRSIRTERGFFRRPLSYEFYYTLTEGDDPMGGMTTERDVVDAREILFAAINRHSYELRGRSELYRLLPWLQADKTIHEEMARQEKWRNAIYWHVKIANATAEVLAAVKSIWRKPPPPGSAYISSDKQELIAVNNPSSGGSAEYIARALRLMVILGARLPEYFFADGQNSNLASATKQELPALAKFDAFQHVLTRQVWTPLFKRVVQSLVDAGEIPEYVEVQDANWNTVYEPNEDPDAPQVPVARIRAIDAFEVAYEPVTQQNLLTQVHAYVAMINNDLASVQTAQENLGLDPFVERQRITIEQSQRAREVARGQRPDWNMTPPQEVDEEEEEEETDEREPAPAEASA